MTAIDEDVICLTTEQVYRLTGIAVNTLRGWRHRSQGPPSFRAGGVVLYRKVLLLQWLDEQERAEVDRR